MQVIRNHSLTRRAAAMLLAVLALGLVAPVAAGAQQITPTDEQYENGILDDGASGEASETGEVAGISASGSGGSGGSEIGELPFTGLDVAAIAAIGVGLVGAGLLIRRAARSGQDSAV